MKYLALLALSLCVTAPLPGALAQTEAPVAQEATLEAGEIALEGEVRGINGATGEVVILATAFSTPNGRKELESPKPKTLITTATTRLIDLRLGSTYGLGDLKIGLKLRAVGRDVGTGKPLRARSLEWRSLVPPIPPDPDTPAPLRELLPPPADSKGVRVRVFDGGFQPENQIFSWSKETRPVFFLSYRVFEPRDATTKRPYYEWGRLLGVRSPDGDLLRSSGAGWNGKTGTGRTLSFPKVDPQWKSVTAIWETTSPDARADSNGRFRGTYTLKGELPTPDNPKTTPDTQVTTERGTVLTLASIACDWEKKTTTYLIKFTRPEAAPDAAINADFQNIVDEQNRSLKANNSLGNSQPTQRSLLVRTVPEAGAKEVKITLDVTEFAESWKQKEAYNTLEIEVPVAALLRANPPVVPPGAKSDLPSWDASNAKFAARIEEVQRGENYLGLVWVAPLGGADANAAQTLVETVAVPVELRARDIEGKERKMAVFSERSDERFFHSDGQAPVPGETATRFNIGNGKFGATTDFSLDVRSFARLRHSFSVKDLAVAPNSQRAIDEPVGQGTLQLQKIGWLDADALDKLLLAQATTSKLRGQTALVAVFAHTPLAPGAKVELGQSTLRDSTGVSVEIKGPLLVGDLLGGTTTGALSLIMPAPSAGATSIDLDVRATETSDARGETATLQFPAVTWEK